MQKIPINHLRKNRKELVMKTIRLIVALLVVAVMTGCATGFDANNTRASQATQKKAPCTPKKVITHGVAGGAIGGAAQALGMKGAAAAGALAGVWHGIMQDETDCEYEETVKRVEERGGGKSAATLRSEADERESLDLFRECEDLLAGKSSTTARRSVPDCKRILARASEVRTEVATDKLLDKVYNVDSVGGEYGVYRSSYGGGCVGAYLRANSIRPGHRHIGMWRERAMGECQRGWHSSYGYSR